MLAFCDSQRRKKNLNTWDFVKLRILYLGSNECLHPTRGGDLQMASNGQFNAKTNGTWKPGILMTFEGFRFWANPKWSINLILNPTNGRFGLAIYNLASRLAEMICSKGGYPTISSYFKLVKDDDSADFNGQKVVSIRCNVFQSFYPTNMTRTK